MSFPFSKSILARNGTSETFQIITTRFHRGNSQYCNHWSLAQSCVKYVLTILRGEDAESRNKISKCFDWLLSNKEWILKIGSVNWKISMLLNLMWGSKFGSYVFSKIKKSKSNISIQNIAKSSTFTSNIMWAILYGSLKIVFVI